MPITEGFGCEVPVIGSNCTSVPEVGGDAVLYVDPYSSESIAEGMVRLVRDPGLQKELVEKGRTRKDMFSWERTADLFSESITKTLISVVNKA